LRDVELKGASLVWDFFERIYCISVKERTDRRSSARAAFERVGLSGRVEFVLVDKHVQNSERGIYESHMKCLRAGLKAGAQRIVVFEDDILIDRSSPRTLADGVEFMKSGHPWNMFFFGCFVAGCRRTEFRSVLKVKYRCTAHAYVVNRPFAEKLVAMEWEGLAFDNVLRGLNDDHFYAAYPAFAFQSASPTDNDRTKKIDRIRRLLGGMHWQQKWNEFSHLKWPQMVVGHAVSIGVIVAVVWWIRWSMR
jgi:hypothetical protein